MVIFGLLRSLAILLLTVVASVAACAADVITGNDRMPSSVMRWWGKMFIRFGGWRIRAEGLCHLPERGAILAANHQSLVDIPLCIAAIPREVRFLAKRELGRIPLFGRAMVKAGNLFVDREDPRDAVRLVREASERMGRGQMVVIFPEGTRSRDGSIGEFKPGAFFLARKAGAPLLPVLIDGGWRALPRGSLIFMPATLVVKVLPPVAAGEGGADLDRVAQEARQRILSARDGEDASCRGGGAA